MYCSQVMPNQADPSSSCSLSQRYTARSAVYWGSYQFVNAVPAHRRSLFEAFNRQESTQKHSFYTGHRRRNLKNDVLRWNSIGLCGERCCSILTWTFEFGLNLCFRPRSPFRRRSNLHAPINCNFAIRSIGTVFPRVFDQKLNLVVFGGSAAVHRLVPKKCFKGH